MANFDIWVNILFDNLYQTAPFWSVVASWISTIGGTIVMISLAILLGIYFLARKEWHSAAVMLVSVGGTGIFIWVFKELFMRVRPENALQAIIGDPSFPSGHAGLAAAFFLALAYILAPKIHSLVKRELMIAGFIVVIILIGLSRLVLNVHWASDVLAGWSLGIFITIASILLVGYVGALVVKKS